MVNGMLLPMRMSFTYNYLHGRSLESPTIMDQRSHGMLNMYVESKDRGPVSSLYLTIRSARKAIRDNPEDAEAYLALAKAYISLNRHTQERAAAGNLSIVTTIRNCQAAAALRSLLALHPRPEMAMTANDLLASVLSTQREYFESYVVCFKEIQKLSRLVEHSPEIKREILLNEQDRLDKTIKALDQKLKQQLDNYEVSSVGKPLLQKAAIALDKGLSEKALTLLLNATPEELTDKRNPRERPGATLAISLLLGLGRVEECARA